MSSIEISLKDAEVLGMKWSFLLVVPLVHKSWIPHFVGFCKGIEVAEDQLSEVVQIELETAKFLRGILNDHLVAHPYEKDQFFAELRRLEEAIERAKKEKEAA